jgi:hypothetical protein
MPLTASELTQQRLANDKVELDRVFKQEWDMTRKRFGPRTNNPRIEEARQRALDGLRQNQTARANKLLGDYEKPLQVQSELAQMVKNGVVTPEAAEEAAQRSLMSSEVERVAFPKEESFAQVEAQRTRLRSELSRFDVGRMEGQGDDARFHSDPETRTDWDRWLQPWRVRRHVPATAGGVYVKEKAWDEDKGKEITRHRPATREEMREYTISAEHLKQVDKEASRLQLAALRSSRMLNQEVGFAEKAVPKTAKPVYAKNPKTGERVVSNDGGKTWQSVE